MNTFNFGGCLVNVENDIGDAAINAVGYLVGLTLWIQWGTFANVEVDIDAMPGYTTQSHRIYKRRSQIFFLLIPLQWESYETKAKTVYSFDGEQGGKYPFASFGGGGFLENAVSNAYSPCIDFFHPAFNFIPTASALNIPELKYQPWQSFDPATYLNGGNNDFDKAFVLDPATYPITSPAPTNESHLDLTPSNVFPFSEFISPDFNSINTSSTIDDYTWNFGYGTQNNVQKETTDRITRLVTVGGSLPGAVCINCLGIIEKSNNLSNPANEANHFAVELTRNCGSGIGRLNIGANGTLKIGENNQKTGVLTVREGSYIYLNGGLIEIREGSKLIIDAGAELRLNAGQLKVYDGGEVIIKPGALLRYENGAVIELNGNNAVLASGGLIHVGNDATFGFTWQGSESGYLRMLNEGHWGERFSAGTNAKVKLEGTGQDDLILYMEVSADFWEYDGPVPGTNIVSQNFKRIDFRNGRIQLENDARIVLKQNSRFSNVKLRTEYGHISRGVVTFTVCEFSGSSVFRTNIDARFHINNTGILALTNSGFLHTGVQVRGRNYRVYGCNFQYSGISSLETTLMNSILSSSFNNCVSAVDDESLTELYVYQTIFTNNSYGISKSRGRTTVKCSEFRNNGKPLNGYLGNEINISTIHSGGYNLFDHNDYNIYVWDAAGIMMQDGYNRIYDGNIMNIAGTLNLPWQPNCPPGINANNNIWTPLSGPGPFGDPNHPDENEFNVTIQSFSGTPFVQIHCYIGFSFGNVPPIPTCGQYDRPDRDPVEGPKSNGTEVAQLPLISTPLYFTDTPLDLALREAAGATTVNDSLSTDDLLAADMYYEILMADVDSAAYDSLQSVVNELLWSGLYNYKAAIERMLVDSTIIADQNTQSFTLPVQQYVDVLMHFTDSTKTTENYHRQFRLELAKASLFGSLGSVTKALQIVANIDLCEHDSLQKILLTSQIENYAYHIQAMNDGYNAYLYDGYEFVIDSALFAAAIHQVIDSSGFASYIQSPVSILFGACMPAPNKALKPAKSSADFIQVFPNPAGYELSIQISQSESAEQQSAYYFELHDLSGRVVFRQTVKGGGITTLSLPKLGSALYVYRITENQIPVHHGRLSILQ